MKKIFEIDNISKEKIIAAYDIYRLRSKILYVQYSYKKDNFNVYAFSDNFHIGINVDGNIIHQRFIKPDIENIITEEYAYKEQSAIKRNLELSEEEINDKFKKARIKINIAIEEFINRNIVYKNYMQAKKNQIDAIKENIIKRIKDEEDLIDRIRDQKVRFSIISSNPDDISYVDLKISAGLVTNERGRSYLNWYIVKNRENLNTLLNKSTEIFPNDEISRGLYEYILITSYYINNNALFENLFKVSQSISNQPDAFNIIKRLFEDSSTIADRYHLHKPIRETYKIQDEIRTGNRPRILDYNSINDVDHLRKIHDLYMLLVERHKKYISMNIKEIEKNFFGLNIPLAGSKTTKQVLNSVLQIETLINRMTELENTLQ